VQVYRADEADAAHFMRLLTLANLPFEIERFGAKVAYVTVKSVRPDIPGLARSAGRTVRRVHNLDQPSAPEIQ
jgi:hypothetical protein